jgi:hypothetical protein
VRVGFADGALMLQSLLQCNWIEGSRTFNVLFGAATAAVCFAVAIPVLWWVLPKHQVWLFSRRVDRYRRIQLAYGLFCMSMAFTDAGCRFFPHAPLPWVHPAFFLTTLLIGIGLGPRVVYLIARERRLARAAAIGATPVGRTSPLLTQ